MIASVKLFLTLFNTLALCGIGISLLLVGPGQQLNTPGVGLFLTITGAFNMIVMYIEIAQFEQMTRAAYEERKKDDC